MSEVPIGVPRGSLWAAFGSLLVSTSTLVCCVLPALMVALGAGAALAGLVTAVPGLVWLSAHKALVFGVAGVALAGAGWMQWRARSLPCPADPALAAACTRTRRAAAATYGVGVGIYALGALFAFGLPLL
jgi:hypothetical protein